MTSHLVSGSVYGPFEKAKSSVYYMAMGILEHSFVSKMIEEEKVEALCNYLLTDPSLHSDQDKPN